MGTTFLAPEMAHDVIETESFFWTTRTLNTILSFCILIMLFYHIYAIYSYDAYKNEQLESSKTSTRKNSYSISKGGTSKKRQSSKWATLLHILTILFILPSFITILML